MGVVIIGHIWWEIPTCNDCDVIYGGKSQPVMTYDVIYGGKLQQAMDDDITSCHKAL